MAPLPFVVKGMDVVNIDYRLAHDSLPPPRLRTAGAACGGFSGTPGSTALIPTRFWWRASPPAATLP